MRREFTKLLGMAFAATVFTASLTAQSSAKVEAQVARIESRSALMPDHKAERAVQLRAADKALQQYSISYTGEGKESFKYVYEYDAKGNRISSMGYRWENGDWVISSKSVNEYDDAGKQTSSQSYRWENNDWVNSSKSVNEYNAAGNLTLYEYYNWENNSWVGGSKYVYEYDAAGNRTLDEYYRWENNGWAGSSKYVYEYDANGNYTLYDSYRWETNRWVFDNGRGIFSYKITYVIGDEYIYFGHPMGIGAGWYTWRTYPSTAKAQARYDAKGNLTSFECDGSKFQIKYNRDNNPVSIERADNEGVVYGKEIYEYDESGNCTLYEGLSWYENKWVPSGWKIVMEYDAKGNQTLFAKYGSDWETQSWILESKDEYKYDSFGNMIYYSGDTHRWIDEYDANGNLLSYHSYDIVDGEPVLRSYTLYFYEKEVSNESVSAVQATAYIAGNTLYVTATQNERIAIYSITGSKLYETTATAGLTAIDTSAFPHGILIVKGSAGWGVKVKN